MPDQSQKTSPSISHRPTEVIGTIVLKAQADQATRSEWQLLAREIVRNIDFRKRCVGLGRMLQKTQEEKEGMAAAFLKILLSTTEILDNQNRHAAVINRDGSFNNDLKVYSLSCAAYITPLAQKALKHSASWKHHVKVDTDSGGALVGGEVADVLEAVENLWNVPRMLIHPR